MQEYNEPHKPIRIFPFIIGESTDLEAAKWMACNYKGESLNLSLKARN